MVSTSEFELIGACVDVCVQRRVYMYLLHVYTCLWLHVSTYSTPNQLTETRWQIKSDSKSDRTLAYVTGLVHVQHDSPMCDTTYSSGT